MGRGTPLEQIEEDVKALRRSFESGKTKSMQERKKVLQQIRTMIVEGEAELTAALQLDMHKPPFEAFLTELGMILADIQTHLDYIDEWTTPKSTWTSIACLPGRSFTVMEPYGVACIFGTWNYPVYVTILPLIGAISAGNTALIRLAADGSVDETNAVLAKLLDKYVDKDFVRYAKGGLDVSKKVLALKYDVIFCTGGQVIGKAVARAAAENLTPIILELGGKTPTIVDKTANIEVAARRIAWGAFINCGQTCVRPDHVYVSSKIGDAFVEALKNAIISMFTETPETSDDYARVANNQQLFKMKAMIEKEKSFVFHGGQSNVTSRFVAPTLFNYKNDLKAFEESAAMQDEIFGPLLPIVYFDDDINSVVAAINRRPKPLSLYVFSTNEATIDLCLNSTSSGSVCINDCVMQMGNHHLPFGGVGNSGLGSYHGKHSFNAFSHEKAVLRKYYWLDLPQRYMPYTDQNKKILRLATTPIARVHVRRAFTLFAVLALAWLLRRPKVYECLVVLLGKK
ncbi:aldehyde dehydrogenase [Thraustotheca clavata]|uniref:Aldehyde dehydrogenase n=1 Tax=Thraustotheca clavata TaxID=74557 RepID=A0A1V9Z985_9STRA|nr:aldehyde dehydrogenase [Thraustotheca clavata]